MQYACDAVRLPPPSAHQPLAPNLLFYAALSACVEVGSDAFLVKLETAATAALIRQILALDLAPAAHEASCLFEPRLGRRRAAHCERRPLSVLDVF